MIIEILLFVPVSIEPADKQDLSSLGLDLFGGSSGSHSSSGYDSGISRLHVDSSSQMIYCN